LYLDRGGRDTAGVEHGCRDTANVEVEFAIAGGEAVQPGVYHRAVKFASTGRGVLGEAGQSAGGKSMHHHGGCVCQQRLAQGGGVHRTGRRARLGREVPGTRSGVFSMYAMSLFLSTPSRTVS
jgi:hypothetical protein